ncbi:DUF2877 domain-containing protein [Epidermidibacterium keratini]|uniref:DUF2877 domain-containing protein n=1 Tax=Epidermidibacterium keratini TaxID=1891644 RepID=A0A7L4YJH4_9ACTN|nr:DUF2877 domain-containing protein [Epidermidibacterium keratini]QHB98978.1 DUF2877 domain-containing protein [Epidermidibacterium keratini]
MRTPALARPTRQDPDAAAVTPIVASAAAAAAATQLIATATGPGRRVAEFAHTQLFELPTCEGTQLLALTTGSASYSANSVRLPATYFHALDGERLEVTGTRELTVGALRITITRTWRSAVPRLVRNRTQNGAAPPISTRTGDSGAILQSAIGARPPAPTTIDQLIGWGGGLTPTGDDIVCGLLAAARAYADPRLADWSAQTAARLHATTDLSAQFLRLAMAGHVTAELRELLLALDTPHLAAAVRRLLRVGHASGADLGTGVLRYLELRHLDLPLRHLDLRDLPLRHLESGSEACEGEPR